MWRTILLALILICGWVKCVAQSSEDEGRGTLRVSIPSFAYEIVDPNDNHEPYEVSVKKGTSLIRVPYVGRTEQKSQNGNSGSHIDNYEIKLKKGLYRLIINDSEGYRLPNFSIIVGETVHFRIPQFRFAWHEVCKDGQRILPTLNSERTLESQRLKYLRPPYQKVRTEVFVLEKPFEMVIHYCHREVRGSAIQYRSAEVYYKNYYISADTLILRKENLQIEALGSKEAPLVEINGKEIGDEKMKIVVDLRKGKLVDK